MLFSACTSLTEITIPEYVESIELEAFVGYESLKKITILNPECEIDDSPTTICNTYDYSFVAFS